MYLTYTVLCNFSSIVNMGHPNISYNIYIMDDSQNWVDELQYSNLLPWFVFSPLVLPKKNLEKYPSRYFRFVLDVF